MRAGTATFETEYGDVAVGAREIVRFPPGEFQRGWNNGTERAVALALGAPLEYGEQIKLWDCPECGERTDSDFDRRVDDVSDEEFTVALCKRCGAETGHWTEESIPGRVP